MTRSDMSCQSGPAWAANAMTYIKTWRHAVASVLPYHGIRISENRLSCCFVWLASVSEGVRQAQRRHLIHIYEMVQLYNQATVK